MSSRSIYSLVISDRFEEIFEKLGPDDRDTIVAAIGNNDSALVRHLVKQFAKVDLTLMAIKDLRILGSKYSIQGYNNMPKLSLIASIKERMNAKSEAVASARFHVGPPTQSQHKAEAIAKSHESF